MNVTTKRIKNEDGSYSVIAKFDGSQMEVLNAMNEFEELVEKEIGRKPDLKTLDGGRSK